jgi:hypothetical protein
MKRLFALAALALVAAVGGIFCGPGSGFEAGGPASGRGAG